MATEPLKPGGGLQPEPITLKRFSAKFEEDLEELFQEDMQEKLLRGHRTGLVVVAAVCAIYALLDWIIMPDLRYLVWFLRCIILTVALCSIMLTYWRPMRSMSGALAVISLFLSSLGTMVMQMFAPPEVAGSYFAGLLINIMLCFGILRLEFITSVLCGALLMVLYNVGTLLYGTFTPSVLIMHNFIYATGILLGSIQSYGRNRMVREMYSLQTGEAPVFAPEPAEVEALLSYRVPDSPSDPFKDLEEFAAPAATPEPPAEAVSPYREEEEAIKPPVRTSTEAEMRAERRTEALEKELKDAGMLFNLFMERISDVVWFADPDGRFVYVSPSCERIWGYSVRELKKKTFREILTKESYEYFAAELNVAGKSSAGSIRPMEFEIVCKNRVLKTAETMAITIRNHETYGSGTIGVTRDLSFRQKTEAELRKFNRELETLIKQRSTELENSLARLKDMEENLRGTPKPEQVEDLPMVRYLRGNLEAMHKLIFKLQEATRKAWGNYDIKTMKKEDLEEYLHLSREMGIQLEASVRDSLNHLLMGDEAPEAALRAEQPTGFRFRFGDHIENVLMGYAKRFQRTGHMVDVDCPDSLEVYGEPEDYTTLIQGLVSYSLDVGLSGVPQGLIEIQVRENSEGWRILYRDNGKGMTAETIDQLFEKPYAGANDRAEGLRAARDVARDALGGEFRLEPTDAGLVFEILIPYESHRIA